MVQNHETFRRIIPVYTTSLRGITYGGRNGSRGMITCVSPHVREFMKVLESGSRWIPNSSPLESGFQQQESLLDFGDSLTWGDVSKPRITCEHSHLTPGKRLRFEPENFILMTSIFEWLLYSTCPSVASSCSSRLGSADVAQAGANLGQVIYIYIYIYTLDGCTELGSDWLVGWLVGY